MDRVNEIIGHLTDEEYDAVLYGVMRIFLNKKSKEFNIPFDELYLQIFKENEILLLKESDYGDGVEVLQELEI